MRRCFRLASLLIALTLLATAAGGTARTHATSPAGAWAATGTVLVVGGNANVLASAQLYSAELYDPTTGTWTATGSLSTARRSHTATLLATGTVLVAGGSTGPIVLASAELYSVVIVDTTAPAVTIATHPATPTQLPAQAPGAPGTYALNLTTGVSMLLGSAGGPGRAVAGWCHVP